MSNLRVAVHKLEVGGADNRKSVPPGALIVLDAKDLADMEALGAVREPTEAEIALHEKMEAKAEKKAAKPAGGRGRGRGHGHAADDAGDAGDAAVEDTVTGENAEDSIG